MSQLCRLFDQAQLHHQGGLVPLDPARLVVPVLGFGGELHVEAPHHARKDKAHFEVRKTKSPLLMLSMREMEGERGNQVVLEMGKEKMWIV